jgi:hypothetical protein
MRSKIFIIAMFAFFLVTVFVSSSLAITTTLSTINQEKAENIESVLVQGIYNHSPTATIPAEVNGAILISAMIMPEKFHTADTYRFAVVIIHRTAGAQPDGMATIAGNSYGVKDDFTGLIVTANLHTDIFVLEKMSEMDNTDNLVERSLHTDDVMVQMNSAQEIDLGNELETTAEKHLVTNSTSSGDDTCLEKANLTSGEENTTEMANGLGHDITTQDAAKDAVQSDVAQSDVSSDLALSNNYPNPFNRDADVLMMAIAREIIWDITADAEGVRTTAATMNTGLENGENTEAMTVIPSPLIATADGTEIAADETAQVDSQNMALNGENIASGLTVRQLKSSADQFQITGANVDFNGVMTAQNADPGMMTTMNTQASACLIDAQRPIEVTGITPTAIDDNTYFWDAARNSGKMTHTENAADISSQRFKDDAMITTGRRNDHNRLSASIYWSDRDMSEIADGCTIIMA